MVIVTHRVRFVQPQFFIHILFVSCTTMCYNIYRYYPISYLQFLHAPDAYQVPFRKTEIKKGHR